MKEFAALSVLAATLFAGGVTASAETTETMDDVVKVTAVEGVGYKFELSHKACSMDKHIVTSETATTMIAPDTDNVTQETADKLASVYKLTIGKAMGTDMDAFYGSYNANEINSWKKAAEEGRKPKVTPTKEMVQFIKAVGEEFEAFHEGMASALGSAGFTLTLNMGGVAADTPSPLCK
jgi:hypothetical protein